MGFPKQESWRGISYSRGSSDPGVWPRGQTRISWLAGRFSTTEPPGKPNLWLATHKYGWCRRLVSFPLLPAEKKAGWTQGKISWSQPLGSRGFPFWIRPLPWPGSLHCCVTTYMCPGQWPCKCMEHSLPELWLSWTQTSMPGVSHGRRVQRIVCMLLRACLLIVPQVKLVL